MCCASARLCSDYGGLIPLIGTAAGPAWCNVSGGRRIRGELSAAAGRAGIRGAELDVRASIHINKGGCLDHNTGAP